MSFSHRLLPGLPAFTPGQALQGCWDEVCRPVLALQGGSCSSAAPVPEQRGDRLGTVL